MAKKKKKKASSNSKKDEGETYFEIKLSNGDKLVCRKNVFKGRSLFDIRRMWFNDETEEWGFGKGIAMSIGDGVAEEFIKKFRKAFKKDFEFEG